jgi:heat shock protein HslJ/uncharacterized membrane protein/membrane-bound inhibitor of C-type lysozyme
VNSKLRLSALTFCIALSACHSAGPADSARASGEAPTLAGTSWVTEDIDGIGVLEGVQSTIVFESEERIVGSTGCNQYFAPFRRSGATLRIGTMGSTRRACPPPVMNQEGLFLAALAAAATFRHEGRVLWLIDESGRARVRLTRVGERAEVARAFECSDGPGFVLVPVLGGDAALELSRDVLRLTPAPAASGARYSDGRVSVWNKGGEALLELGGFTYRCTESRAGSIRADARLRGVDFRATGNEPGWVLEVLRDRIVFMGSNGTERVTVPRLPPQIDFVSGETLYLAETDVHRVRILIRERECVDSMSGDRSEASVSVEIDERAYRGCGYTLP